MSSNPTPESLAAAERIAAYQDQHYGPISPGYPGPSRASSVEDMATLIDTSFAGLRERCEELERENERLRRVAFCAVAMRNDFREWKKENEVIATRWKARVPVLVEDMQALYDATTALAEASNAERAALSPTPQREGDEK